MIKKTLFLAASLAFSYSSFAQESAKKDSSTSINLSEVQVTALKSNLKLKDLTCKVEVVNATTVKTSAAQNVGQLLKTNSSIDIIEYPGLLSSIGMRGFQPDGSRGNKYNALLIDGLPAGTRNISTLGLSNIEQVEILKGPFSSLYGSSAMSGVINIVTPRHKGDFTGKATTSFGSFMTSHADVALGGQVTGPLNFDLSVFTDNEGANYKIGKHNLLKMSATEKAILDNNSYGATFNNSKYSQMGGTLRLGYDINHNWECHIFEDIYQAKDVLSHGSFWGVYGNNKKDLTRWATHLEIQGRINNHTIKFRPYFSNDASDYYNTLTDTAFVYYKSKFTNFGAQLQDNITLGNHNIVIGLDNATEQNKTKYYANASTEKSPYNPDYENMATGAFVQTYLKFFDNNLNVSAGVRFDNIRFKLNKNNFLGNDEKTETYKIINPNIGIKYNFFGSLSFHTSWGTAFYAPDATQKAGSYTYYGTKYVGNPDLKAEKSQTIDLGIGYKDYSAGIESDVTFFHTDHKNKITSASVNPDNIYKSGDEYITYINASKAYMTGLEVLASYDFGAIHDYHYSLKTYVNATFMFDTRVKTTSSWDQMKYVRKQNANFGVEFASKNGLQLRLNGRYIGSRIEDNWFSYYSSVRAELAALAPKTQSEYYSKGLLKHPDFLVFDMSAFYKFTQHFEAGLSMANLLDENYTEKDGYNMPGRSITAKCIVKF